MGRNSKEIINIRPGAYSKVKILMPEDEINALTVITFVGAMRQRGPEVRVHEESCVSLPD